jgi:hypothetical protein
MTIGMRTPIFQIPIDCSSVPIPQSSRSAATRYTSSCCDNPSPADTITGTVTVLEYMISRC